MNKKIVSVIMAAGLISTMAGCGQDSSNDSVSGMGTSASGTENAAEASSASEVQKEEEKLQIVATLQSQQINFWSNVQHTLERLAEENNFELTIMDFNNDVTRSQEIIDDILAMKPDGVITCALEASTLTTQVKMLQDAGIPVVTYNISPDEDICPMVITDHYEFGYVAGTSAAEYWKENHEGETPVGGAIDLYSAPVCADRVQGFVEGFQTVYPDFELVQKVDGAGSRSSSLAAAEDMLQAHPEINVIFGINADSALGGLDALKELGRGTADQALVASVDGTETDCTELKNADSALKAIAGNSPRIMAETAWNVLSKVLNGELDAKEAYSEKMEIVSVTEETADEWVTENFE